MKPTLQNHLLFLAISTFLLCAGCTTGPNYTQTPKITIPAGKALIYVYRKPDPAGGLDTWNIAMNGQYLGNLKNGTYLTYVANPGKTEISGRKGPSFTWGVINALDTDHKMLEVTAEPGKTYYVRFMWALPNGLQMPYGKLEWVRDETGAKQIRQCKMAK